jgi:hypothetical protein
MKHVPRCSSFCCDKQSDDVDDGKGKCFNALLSFTKIDDFGKGQMINSMNLSRFFVECSWYFKVIIMHPFVS